MSVRSYLVAAVEDKNDNIGLVDSGHSRNRSRLRLRPTIRDLDGENVEFNEGDVCALSFPERTYETIGDEQGFTFTEHS